MQISAIDTHIHSWDPQRVRYSWLDNVTVLNRAFLLEDMEELRVDNNVSAGVLVQAANSIEDTDFMLETARNHTWIKGVVGWLPLVDPEETGFLLGARYLSTKLLCGFRHLIHDEADPRWLLQEKVLVSLEIAAKAELPFDFVGVTAEHLETAIELSSRLPELKMVFDHLNQPPNDPVKFDRWKSLLKELSLNENLHVKISGLGTARGKGEHWTAEDIKPAVAFVLEQFGEDRCFCGGDWPVSLLAGSYSQAWSNYRQVLAELLNEEGAGKGALSECMRFLQS